MKREHIGSDFDGFLQEDGLLAECEAGALQRVVTWQIEREMKRRKISRVTLQLLEQLWRSPWAANSRSNWPDPLW